MKKLQRRIKDARSVLAPDRPAMSPIPPQTELTILDGLREAFSEFEQIGLLATFSGLQVIPDFQSATVRLEVATRIAASIRKSGSREPSLKALEKAFNESLPPEGYFGIYEDPLEDVFTENIQMDGNFIVYAGIAPGEARVLQVLLEAMAIGRGILPKEAVLELCNLAKVALIISNEIANRMGHRRYLEGGRDFRERLDLKEESLIQRASSSIRFTNDEIEAICRNETIDPNILQPLIMNAADAELDENTITLNPLIRKPFLRVGNEIIVALPGSICLSLRHFILSKAHSEGFLRDLLSVYHSLKWSSVTSDLKAMSFEPSYSQLDLPPMEIGLGLAEAVFQVDVDKLTYVQYIPDECDGFDADDPDTIWKHDKILGKSSSRSQQILQFIKEKDGNDLRIRVVKVLGYVGRGVIFGQDLTSASQGELFLFPSDIELMAAKERGNCLALWKYADSLYHLMKTTEVLSCSEADMYAFYKIHKDSFYVTDEAPPSLIVVDVGMAKALITKTKNERDLHSVFNPFQENWVEVKAFYGDGAIPIYVENRPMTVSPILLVEGYARPIWIAPLIEKIPFQDFDLFASFSETIAYWIWQFEPRLKEHIGRSDGRPICICYELPPGEVWRRNNKLTAGSEDFPHRITKNGIAIDIPLSLRHDLSRSDNDGEKRLMKELLESLAEFLMVFSSSTTLGKRAIGEIIESRMAPERKKKLLMVDPTTNIALSPDYVQPMRLIQDYDSQIQQNDLAKIVFGTEMTCGIIDSKEEVVKVCNQLVDYYYAGIKKQLNGLSSDSVIEFLIGNYEAIIQHRALKRLTAATSIECFASLKEYVEREVAQVPLIDASAVANRLLIEIVAAEPPSGSFNLSLESFDKLLAMASRLIDWAMRSDRIHYDVLSESIEILMSGRVRPTAGEVERLWLPFYEAKTLETVESDLLRFERAFSVKTKMDPPEDSEMWDRAFLEEFGFTMVEMADFHIAVVEIGYSQKRPVSSCRYTDLNKQLEQRLSWNSRKVELMLSHLILSPKAKWEQVPDGFVSSDIMPWHYNRRLSFTRRPIIVGPLPKENPIVFWGPRSVEESIRNLVNQVANATFGGEASSQAMKELIGKMANSQGHEFSSEVHNWIAQNEGWLAYKEVPIRPGEVLASDEDLGDIDVLAIDGKNNAAYSIECKDISYGRNSREIAQEIQELIGSGNHNDSWIDKHKKRDDWIRRHLEKVKAGYAPDLEGLILISIIVTSVEIPSAYFKKTPIKVIAFTKLKREGIAVIRSTNEDEPLRPASDVEPSTT